MRTDGQLFLVVLGRSRRSIELAVAEMVRHSLPFTLVLECCYTELP